MLRSLVLIVVGVGFTQTVEGNSLHVFFPSKALGFGFFLVGEEREMLWMLEWMWNFGNMLHASVSHP